MTPEQQDRATLLKRRNFRRLQQDDADQAFAAAGLTGARVSDERTESLLAKVIQSSPVQGLVAHDDWQAVVRSFAEGQFGLTIGQLWDWDGTVPLRRVAAASVLKNVSNLKHLHPDGFWLVGDEERRLLVVDFDFDERQSLIIVSLAEIELAHD